MEALPNEDKVVAGDPDAFHLLHVDSFQLNHDSALSIGSDFEDQKFFDWLVLHLCWYGREHGHFPISRICEEYTD